MNKSELVEALAKSADITKAKAGVVLDALLDLITTSIAQGQSVALIGFGTFKSALRAAREGRNPATGAPLKIPSVKLPKFTAGSALKAVVAGKKAIAGKAGAKAAAKPAASSPASAKKPAAKRPAAKPAPKPAAKKPAPKKK